jgi:hypothetical protein
MPPTTLPRSASNAIRRIVASSCTLAERSIREIVASNLTHQLFHIEEPLRPLPNSVVPIYLDLLS